MRYSRLYNSITGILRGDDNMGRLRTIDKKVLRVLPDPNNVSERENEPSKFVYYENFRLHPNVRLHNIVIFTNMLS